MGTCCAGCTCGDPMRNPAAPVVDHEIVDVEIVDAEPARNVGWEMYGVVHGRLVERAPCLRKKVGDWPPTELTNGIGFIRAQVVGDEPDAVVLTVGGIDPAEVHATWHRVMDLLSGGVRAWFGDEEVPF